MQLAIAKVNLPYLEIFLEEKYLKDIFNCRVNKLREWLQSLNSACIEFLKRKRKVNRITLNKDSLDASL